MKKQLFGKVAKSLGGDVVEWIVLEEDPDETGGVFVYGHDSLQEKCNFDEWYENIDLAKKSVQKRWEIGEWQTEVKIDK